MDIWINILAGASVFNFIFGLVYFFILSRGEKLNLRLLKLAATVILSIILIEINTVLLSGSARAPYGILLKTMQAFSLDADYESIFSTKVFPDHPFLQFCFEWFRLVVYSLAPLLGGAVVCDILIGLSPDMQLFLKRRRRMFVFSELNRKSIMLAESIFKNEKPEKDIVIVFTNYRPGSDEEADALKFRANELKAICYPGDLLHLKEADHAKQYIFFLMNTKPDGSFFDDKNQVLLQSLLRAEKCIWPKKQGCHFFVFTNEGAAVEDVRGAKAAFDQRRSDDAGEVTIHVIRDYVQAAQNLLLRHPLFESIKGEPAGTPLRVLIIGDGDFARVMFKTVFWCGQILDHPLQLAFIDMAGAENANRAAPGSSEAGSAAPEGWLGRQCPELADSCVSGSECLRASISGEYAAPYASLYFAQFSPDEIQDRDFLVRPRRFQYGSSDPFMFSQFQYIIVMNGQDRNNINLADSFWRSFVYMSREGSIAGRRHIAVAIEDEVLEGTTAIRYENLPEQEQDITLFTFEGDRTRSQWDRLMHSRRDPNSRKALKAGGTLARMPSMDAAQDDFFDEWSGQARRVHLLYKVFSAGCWTDSAENGKNPADPEVCVQDKIRYCTAIRENRELLDRLTWLEHRRWNAFMRTQGFRRPPRLIDMLRKLEHGTEIGTDPEALRIYAYKNIPARLDPGLVESLPGTGGAQPDLLDAVSDLQDYVDALEGRPKRGNIRECDRPDGESGPTVTYGELSRYLEAAENAKAPGTRQDESLREVMKMIGEKDPNLQEYEDKWEPGHYYIGNLLELTGEPEQKQPPLLRLRKTHYEER